MHLRRHRCRWLLQRRIGAGADVFQGLCCAKCRAILPFQHRHPVGQRVQRIRQQATRQPRLCHSTALECGGRRFRCGHAALADANHRELAPGLSERPGADRNRPAGQSEPRRRELQILHLEQRGIGRRGGGQHRHANTLHLERSGHLLLERIGIDQSPDFRRLQLWLEQRHRLWLRANRHCRADVGHGRGAYQSRHRRNRGAQFAIRERTELQYSWQHRCGYGHRVVWTARAKLHRSIGIDDHGEHLCLLQQHRAGLRRRRQCRRAGNRAVQRQLAGRHLYGGVGHSHRLCRRGRAVQHAPYQRCPSVGQ